MVLELLALFGAAALLAFGIKSFVAQAFYIPSGSMLPELQINDRVVVSKLAYRLHDPRRGDIVVFDCPEKACPPAARNSGGNAVGHWLRSVGRAVGLVQPSAQEFIKRVVGLPGERVEAHDGDVFVDGRRLVEPYLPAGTATGDFGPVEVPPGHLFVMGDNRPSSTDSRVFGPIPSSNVVGRTIVRVWPPASAGFL